MALSENALAVLARRYLLRDETGAVTETPDQMFDRVGRAVAASDAAYGAADTGELARRFADRMRRLEFLPNSPTLMNAGRADGQLAACFVVPVEDSTSDIFEAVGWAATIQKTGGGTGFSFSRLRPAGDHVQSTGGIASGPVSFMQVFDVATEAIKQGGARRGANMGVLRVDHPDILDFVAVKLDGSRMQNFNLSVGITDEFMAAVASGGTYPLRHPRDGHVVRELDARRVFDTIVNAAWAAGDPGLVFIDRINASQPTPHLGDIEATNPCGEQPLLPFESCTLGSVNLAKFVRGGEIDWDGLREVIRDGVHFLDNVIDANVYPLPEIAAATRATRKLGLGVMGWADMLVELGVPYDSDRAVTLAGQVASFLESESLAMSEQLAEQRGAFAEFSASMWKDRDRPLRNATTTTVAPTGTISIIAGCSSGIEPLYAIAYERNVLDGERLAEVNPAFRDRAERAGVWSDELLAALSARGRARGTEGVPEQLAQLFPTAHDVPVDVHIRMQAAFQKHVHAAVSKTINLPNTATRDEVAAAYQLAYDLGCKGVTVYRDGSRAAQVLAFGDARTDRSTANGDPCPECQSPAVTGDGCSVCPSCGWSVC